MSDPLPMTTADLCDGDPAVQVIALPWRHYGGRQRMHGPVVTVACPGSVGLVRDTLKQPGDGRVLFVDGGGALTCALLGDRLAGQAVANGWAGVIIHGAVRDTAILATLPLAVMALGSCPRRGRMDAFGQTNLPLQVGGVMVEPGRHVVADEDGLVVVPPGVSIEPASM